MWNNMDTNCVQIANQTHMSSQVFDENTYLRIKFDQRKLYIGHVEIKWIQMKQSNNLI